MPTSSVQLSLQLVIQNILDGKIVVLKEKTSQKKYVGSINSVELKGLIREALKNKVDLNAITSKMFGETLFYFLLVCRYDDCAIAWLQIKENKINLNHCVSNGETPLHWAVKTGNPELVKLMIDQDANINAKTKAGISVLEYAQERQREKEEDDEAYEKLERIQFMLLDSGAQFTKKDRQYEKKYKRRHDGWSTPMERFWGKVGDGFFILGFAVGIIAALATLIAFAIVFATHASPVVIAIIMGIGLFTTGTLGCAGLFSHLLSIICYILPEKKSHIDNLLSRYKSHREKTALEETSSNPNPSESSPTPPVLFPAHTETKPDLNQPTTNVQTPVVPGLSPK